MADLPRLEIPLPARIPESYISHMASRLGIYQRAARIRDRQEVPTLREELQDRFGPPPQEVENLLQVADLPATGTMWGRSLLDVVEGRGQRDVFLFAQTQTRHGKETPVSVPTGQDGWVEHRQAVFDGRFRLIHDLGTDRTELFDVQVDPREMRNLAAEEEYAPELRRLQKQLEAFRRLPAAGENAEDLSPEDIDGLRATGYIGADEEGC